MQKVAFILLHAHHNYKNAMGSDQSELRFICIIPDSDQVFRSGGKNGVLAMTAEPSSRTVSSVSNIQDHLIFLSALNPTGGRSLGSEK